MKRRLVCGDIHGAYKALIQVFKRSKFDYDKDQLICIGDVADGWSQVPQCFDELLKVKNLIYVLGNHDDWLYKWFVFQQAPHIWLSQGGKESIKAYDSYKKDIIKHIKLLNNAYNYYITKDNKLFVHGGYNWHKPIKETLVIDLIWDRHLWETAYYWRHLKSTEQIRIKDYDEVFVGHTSTSRIAPSLKPVNASNVWNVDQGAGWEGKLTLMDIDIKRYWQSDIVSTLYPEEKGRR